MDAKPVLDGFLPSTGGFTKETWQMRPHGTLALLMQDDTALKRVNITLSPDTSIASLMGAAGPGVSAKR